MQKQHYTYADYTEWPDGQRWELISGEAYMMSAAPSLKHQRASRALTRMLDTFLIGKKCEVFAAQTDVRLNPTEGDDCVVQPDLLVVCDAKKLESNAVVGAPDIAIEIVSPSSANYDRVIKYDLYRRYGVKEYWIVDLEGKLVEIYAFEDQTLSSRTAYGPDDRLRSNVLETLDIPVREIFTSAQ